MLDRVKTKAAQFANHTKNSYWEALAELWKITCLCSLFEEYFGERAWKAIGDRLQRPYYLSKVDHIRMIRGRKQTTDIRKYSFVNRTIKIWDKLPAEALELSLVKQKF
jgi:hypothetical protein